MTIQQSAVEITDIEKQLVDYLRSHPQFFEKHHELLAELRIPHRTKATVSLIERQVAILRDQNRQLGGRMKELVDIGRENDQLNARMHHFMVTLLHTTSLDSLLHTLYTAMHTDFAADAVAVKLFVEAGQVHSIDPDLCIDRAAPGLAPFTKALEGSGPLCGQYPSEQLQPLFGDRAEFVASLALVPIGQGQPIGLLAIGSHDVERFHPEMGTLYLQKMGEVIDALIRQHIK